MGTIISPIVIDSGACPSVLPTDWCNHVNLMKAPQPEANESVRAANGREIYNKGQKFGSMMTREVAMRDVSFSACSVIKALGAVSQMFRAGNNVASNPPWSLEGSHIEREETGGGYGWMSRVVCASYMRKWHHRKNRQQFVRYDKGFSLAGEPVTTRRQREFIASPSKVKPDEHIAPIHDGIGDCEAERNQDAEAVLEDTEGKRGKIEICNQYITGWKI